MSTRFTQLDWYDAPKYYDMVFDEGTAAEADFIEEVWEQYGAGKGRARARKVLEPACGSGRLLAEFSERGWSAVGFDASQPMLDYASERFAERGLKARAKLGLLEDFELGTGFHLAHCLVSTFKYLLHEDDARAHLKRVAAALAPGGIYVLGFHLTDYSDAAQSRERWDVTRGDTRVVCTISGWPPNRRTRLEACRSRLRVEEGDEHFAFETEWNFRTYDARQFMKLLSSVPQLELAGLYDFTYDLEDPRTLDDGYLDKVFVLRRLP